MSLLFTLFAISTGAFAQSFVTLVDFGGSNSAPYDPTGNLVLGKDGNFYGTTLYGGRAGTGNDSAHFGGTIYKLTPAGTPSIVYAFCADTSSDCPDGYSPNGLVLASDGNFYGTTRGQSSAGTVFRMAPDGSVTTIHTFAPGEGAYPSSPLVQGRDGSLYGTARDNAFKVTTDGVLTQVYSFCHFEHCADGESPQGMVIGADGNVYGWTYDGGSNGFGTIFEVISTGIKQIYSFCPTLNTTGNCPDGKSPTTLIVGPDGALYGTTNYGGTTEGGTAFRINADDTITVLHTFCMQRDANDHCTDGAAPTALLLGKDGNFYGTNGNFGKLFDPLTGPLIQGGTVFRMTPSGVVTTLYSFCSKPASSHTVCLDGLAPNGLAQGQDGTLYGTTYEGGQFDVPPIFQPLQNGSGTIFAILLNPVARATAIGIQTDYLGENKAAFTVWRPSTGYWYSIDGVGGSATGQWGVATDLPVVGDFDGDGKSDFAVFRPATGFWYIKRSSDQQVESKQWGAATDIPIAGDFDGDGKTDLAVYRPSTGYWYVIQSGTNAVLSKQFGELGDTPVVGDFDGDGKSDVAVYRPSNGYWYITQSSNNAVIAKQWGAATDIPVTGDFDGDGKTDIAVYRPSTGYWYIIQSSDGQVVSKQWGQSGDIPVARDYDGDGKTDIAVFRPSTGYWYVIKGTTGQTQAQQWGAATDVPVNSLAR